MQNYQILTDSASDLPKAMLEQLNVMVTPLHVLLRGKNMPDTVEDEGVTAFYAEMRAGEAPKTSAVNPEGWAEVLEPVLASGKDALVLGFSSGLSTTYQSAVIATQELLEKYPERKVRVVDTLSAALGQGLLVWYTCKKRDEGLSLDELADWVENNKLNIAHWFTVDDLVYLKRGGRVSAATAVVGTMLQIKPVLHVDNDGRLVSMVKARGRKTAMNTLVNKMVELGEGLDQEMVFISHGDCIGEAEQLKNLILEKTNAKEVVISNLGAVIGAHAGPGTLALFFLGKER